MQFLKRWGSKCKGFEEFGAFIQGFWEKEGLHAILQKTGFEMQFSKGNMRQDKFRNHVAV